MYKDIRDYYQFLVMEDEPIRNYEDLVPGRHRRSGNERVHPNSSLPFLDI